MKKLYRYAVLPLLLTGCAAERSGSVGIIGGADGPTAIYITALPNWPQLILLAAAVAAVVVLLVRYFKGKK